MKQFKASKLLATAAAGAMMFAGVAAQAATITWSPGTPSAAGSTALAGGVAFGTIYDGTAVKTDRINMIAVNDNLSGDGTCAGNAFSCWNLNFDSAGNFTESFTFLVTSTTLTGSGASTRIFGVDSLNNPANPGPYTQSFVKVQASLSGSLAGGATTMAALASATTNTQIADLLTLSYNNTGTFAYSFHEDLNVSAAGTAIGTFNVKSGGSDVGNSDARIELGWDTVASADLSPEWTNASGNAFNPFTDLLNDITQGVEIVGKVAGFSASGGSVQIYSRGAIAGFSEFPAVPEPGALALFGIGLIGLGVVARRRASKGIAQA